MTAGAIVKPYTHFYPRPPRGGRLTGFPSLCRRMSNFYPRPPRGGRLIVTESIENYFHIISIHALLAEGDARADGQRDRADHFYPRPPRGGRRAQIQLRLADRDISIHALREEGDDGSAYDAAYQILFLSTPSARRATAEHYPGHHRQPISIHALREEGDTRLTSVSSGSFDFYPRPPRGGRQQKQRENTLLLSHYTPLCTNCKEMLAKQTAKSHRYLRKRLVFRCEASRKTMCAADSHWPDIKRSARCLGQILGAVQRARPWFGSCCPAGRTADCPRQGRSGRSALL